MKIALDKITPDPKQPRKLFDADKLAALAASIQSNGLLQPIIVREGAKRGTFIIVAGERRWRAHCLLRDRGVRKYASIDVIVRKMGGAADIRVKQIVENIARADMTPMEEAEAMQGLVELGMTEEEIAKKLGLVLFRVKWRLSLLNLSPQIRQMLEAEQIDKQSALEVARLPSHEDQSRIVKMINRRELVGWKSVRNAVEAIIQGTTHKDLFGEAAPLPKAAERAIVKGMEKKIDDIASMVATGWKNGECVVASKIAPDRAAVMADKIAGIRSALSHMERELRHVNAQAKIVMTA